MFKKFVLLIILSVFVFSITPVAQAGNPSPETNFEWLKPEFDGESVTVRWAGPEETTYSVYYSKDNQEYDFLGWVDDDEVRVTKKDVFIRIIVTHSGSTMGSAYVQFEAPYSTPIPDTVN